MTVTKSLYGRDCLSRCVSRAMSLSVLIAETPQTHCGTRPPFASICATILTLHMTCRLRKKTLHCSHTRWLWNWWLRGLSVERLVIVKCSAETITLLLLRMMTKAVSCLYFPDKEKIEALNDEWCTQRQQYQQHKYHVWAQLQWEYWVKRLVSKFHSGRWELLGNASVLLQMISHNLL